MGLYVSHGCWRGAYTAFMRWRQFLAKAAGLPPLLLMEGYYDRSESPILPRFIFPMDLVGERDVTSNFHYQYQEGDFEKHPILGSLPIPWTYYEKDPLTTLLLHSDCDGSIAVADCGPLADRLTELLPKLEGDGGGHLGDVREKTETFIAGLRRAVEAGEDVQFS